jgi:hypothetical protein
LEIYIDFNIKSEFAKLRTCAVDSSTQSLEFKIEVDHHCNVRGISRSERIPALIIEELNNRYYKSGWNLSYYYNAKEYSTTGEYGSREIETRYTNTLTLKSIKLQDKS